MNNKVLFRELQKININEKYIIIHSDLTSFISKNFTISSFSKKLIKSLGKNKTLIFPTFTFGNYKIWNYNNSKSECGILSEYFRKKKKSIRTINPFHSVCIFGKNRFKVPHGLMKSSFGKNSVWEWLCNNKNVANLSIGIGIDGGGTFCHYVEYKSKVKYRKNIKRKILINISKNKSKKITFNYFARKNNFIKNNWKKCEKDLTKHYILKKYYNKKKLLFTYCNIQKACKFLEKKIEHNPIYFL